MALNDAADNIATYDSPVNFYIPQSVPPGLEPGVADAIYPIYTALQQVIQTFINYCGIGPQPPDTWSQIAGFPQTIMRSNLGRFYVIADEDISFGAFVTIINNAGIAHAVNANATDKTRPAHGFCNVSGGMPITTAGEVIMGSGLNTVTGVTVGVNYYLSTTAGLPTATCPNAAGNIGQYLGIAIDPQTIYVQLGPPLNVYVDVTGATNPYFGP